MTVSPEQLVAIFLALWGANLTLTVRLLSGQGKNAERLARIEGYLFGQQKETESEDA